MTHGDKVMRKSFTDCFGEFHPDVADLIVTNVQHLDEMHGVKAYDRILAEHANGSSYEGAERFFELGTANEL